MTPESKKSLETWRSLTTFYSRGTTTREASSSLLVSLQNAHAKDQRSSDFESQVHRRQGLRRERERERVGLKLKGLDRIVSQVTHEIKLVVCGLG